MAQIYSQKIWNHVNYHTNGTAKLWNHVNYHTNGSNLWPKAMESRQLPYKLRKSIATSYGITQITTQMAQIYSHTLWNHVNYHTNGANLKPNAMESC
jgi:hypothetical protein